MFKALKFVASFAILSVAAYFFISLFFPLKLVAAEAGSFFLTALGKPSYAETGLGLNPVIVSSDFSAEIVDLCSGAIETAVLFGIIFASEDRRLYDRARGFAAGAVALAVFNAARISLTLALYSPSFPTASAVLHDVLFRASIVVFVAAYYAIWYYWGELAGKVAG